VPKAFFFKKIFYEIWQFVSGKGSDFYFLHFGKTNLKKKKMNTSEK
jgi:hypothetical protein